MAVAIGVSLVATPVLAADIPVKAPAYKGGPSTVYFGGAAADDNSWFSDLGAVWAYNGNLNTDGALLRVRGGVGEYSYLMAPGAKASADHYLGELMFGYQRFVNKVRYTGYIGAQVQHHDNNTDPAAFNGTEWGLVLQGEILAPFQGGFGLLLGQYSTAHDTYFVLGKLGYYVAPGISVGPEVILQGNTKYDAVNAGLSIGFDVAAMTQVIFAGGYSWKDRDNNVSNQDGPYGTVHVRVLR